MEVDDTGLIETPVQSVNIIRELDAVVLDDVRGTTHTGSGVVSVFGNLISSTGNDKAGGSGDVKGVLAVATSADDIDVPIGLQKGRDACLQDAVAKAQQQSSSPHGRALRDLTGGRDSLSWSVPYLCCFNVF